MPRPKNVHPVELLELRVTPKLLRYLDQIVQLESHGTTRQEAVKRLVWDGINDLLAKKLIESQE